MKMISCLLFVIFVVTAGSLWSIWGIFPPLQKDKEKENEAMIRKITALIPKGGIGIECPCLNSGHRITNEINCMFRLPNICTSDPEVIKQLFNEYLQQIIIILNTTPEIRPYIKNFPLSPDGLCLQLNFGKSGKESLIKPYISCATYLRGEVKLYCEIDRDIDPLYSGEVVQSYSASHFFEDIAKAVLSENETKSEIKISPSQKFRDCMCDSQKNVFYFGTKFAKTNNLHFLAYFCDFPFFTYKKKANILFEMAYCGQERYLTFDDAKKLVRSACEEHLTFYQKDSNSNSIMKCHQGKNKLTVDGKAQQENIAFRFSFWDKYIDRIKPPYIAEIYVVGQNVYYYTADEYQRLVLLEKEDLTVPSDQITPASDGKS